MTEGPMLELRGITKRFPGVLANDDVSFDLKAGEVHALLGENGAGKSTLMKILYGLYEPDAGEVLVNGSVTSISDPADAIAQGIGMVHQHFMLVPSLTVAENVALGLDSSRRPFTDLDKVAARIRELGETYGLSIDSDAAVWQLSVGERQRIEILKALYRDAHILVLDEPTAVLTPQEVDDLFVTFGRMTDEGKGLIFISHKLHEVLEVSGRITVMRLGKVVGSVQTAEATRQILAELMVGRDVSFVPDKAPREPAEVLLAIRNLTVAGDRGLNAVNGLNLEVRAGEIVGIAGVSGNGQREFAEAVAGMRDIESGTIELSGVDIAGAGPSIARANGLGYVPEERMHEGMIGAFTVAENLILVHHDEDEFSNRGMLRFPAIRRHAERLVEEYAIKTPSIDTHGSSLSGGNIQKMIMARELDAEPAVLLAAQPTRGVDIGAAEYIHSRLIAQRDAGVAVLMISEDLDEVLAVADRIAVMYEGEITGIVDAGEAKREDIGLLMAGG